MPVAARERPLPRLQLLTDVQVAATDGYALAATEFRPGALPSRVVLIAPATGVQRRLYRAYAEFLVSRGFGVVTWDWRGTGESRPRTLRGFRATMRDWAERDLTGVIDWAAARHPKARLLVVGHSFGGQAVGLARNADRLDGLLTVGAQSGYWGHWQGARRFAYAALWYAAMPAVTRALGYFPGAAFRLGEDLPAGVALQWAKWGRSPDYLGDWGGHRAFTAPLLSISFADDVFASTDAVDALHREYGSTSRQRLHLTPAEIGVARVGHFGFFRQGLLPQLWARTADWLARPG